jgi:hypothetical protein
MGFKETKREIPRTNNPINIARANTPKTVINFVDNLELYRKDIKKNGTKFVMIFTVGLS